MFSLNDNTLGANGTFTQRVQMLVIGRLVVIFLLLVTSWIWSSGSAQFSLQSIPQGPLLVFIISVGLTVVYFFLIRISTDLHWQIRAQFIIDALLITWLVWRTGDMTSPYITLYIVLIGISSIFMRPVSTIAMAVLCVCLFIALTLLAVFDVLQTGAPPMPVGRVVQILSFHSFAFLVVGLLASKLSEKQMSGEQLREATKSLQNLRALHERIIESIRSGLITTDLEGHIFTFNAAAAEITGYKAEEVKGRSIFTLFANPDDLKLSATENAGSQVRAEADIITPDDFRVRIGYSIADLFSEDNEASGYIVTFQDLTQIRSMEESIRRKDRLAAVGRVGAGLAHEIRNPLWSMRWAIQVLGSSMPPNSVQTDLMGIVLRESDRLNSIITNFLSYAKPKVGNQVEIDVREAINDTVKLLRHSPDVTERHTLAEVLPPTPVFISADQTQIQQVFWNLARNALQAMPEGGRLGIMVEVATNRKVRIIFEDTGRGMPPEQVEQLFEPFSTSTTGGTGLGLSIVYQIIRDHNGSINVRSIEEEGTTITIELPIKTNSTAENGDSHLGRSPIEAYLHVKNSEKEVSS